MNAPPTPRGDIQSSLFTFIAVHIRSVYRVRLDAARYRHSIREQALAFLEVLLVDFSTGETFLENLE